MGWGKVRNPGQQAVDEVLPRAPADFSRQSFWRWVQENAGWDLLNGHNNPLAYAYASQQRQRWHGRGMAAYAEVPLHRAAQPAGFEIVLRQPAELLPALSSGGAAHAQGRYAYAGLVAGEHVTVSSAAATYFVRPRPRDDGRDEIATLFRPYWQAHLVAARGEGVSRPKPKAGPGPVDSAGDDDAR